MKMFQKNRLVLLPALLALIPLTACGSGAGPGGERNAPSSISILADSSLKGAFTQIGHQFESQNSGSTVTFKFGSSADLSQQAVGGAPGDLLTTADQTSMNGTQKVQLNEPKIFATKGSATYAIVTLTQSKNTALSQEFTNLINSPSGQQILLQAGFGAP